VAQFKEEFAAVLSESDMKPNCTGAFSTETLCREMGVEAETIKELEELTGPNKLRCPRESEVSNWDDILTVPDDTELLTVKCWKKIVEDQTVKTANKKSTFLRSKYSEIDCALKAKWEATEAINNEDRISYPEIVVTVSVIFPRTNRRFKTCAVDFHVLGSQKLYELRDKIPCALDHQPIGNFTDTPDYPRDTTLKDICTSSFFYIENTFFNDFRSSANIDLSKVMMDWAKENDTALPSDTKSASMSNVTFNDLRIRLGCPYIFLHQGDCEHLIIFKDGETNLEEIINAASVPDEIEAPKELN